jgi:hypothetical protein
MLWLCKNLVVAPRGSASNYCLIEKVLFFEVVGLVFSQQLILNYQSFTKGITKCYKELQKVYKKL